MTPAIELRGLVKEYGDRRALDGVDLAVRPGEVLGYLGPNGAGKTTTIRIVVGLARPTRGTAAVHGLDCVRDRDRMQRLIGYLPGDFAAYPRLSGAEYLRFLARLRPGTDRQVIEALAKRLDLDLDRRVGALSRGNRQKLGIVQAVMHRPDVVVLDEPTSGLDPLVQREFLDLLDELRADGRTVFLSSHVLSEVDLVADRVAMIREGRLAVVEEVETLKRRSLHRVEMAFTRPPPVEVLRRVDAVRDVAVHARTVTVAVRGSTAELLSVAAPYGIERITSHEPDLEDVFLRYFEEGHRD